MVSQFLRNPFSPSYGFLPYALIGGVGLIYVTKENVIFEELVINAVVCTTLFMASTVGFIAQRIERKQRFLEAEVHALNHSKQLGIVTGFLAYCLTNSCFCANIIALGSTYWHSRKIDGIRH